MHRIFSIIHPNEREKVCAYLKNMDNWGFGYDHNYYWTETIGNEGFLCSSGFAYSSALKMKAVHSFETMADFYKTDGHYNLEDCTLHTYTILIKHWEHVLSYFLKRIKIKCMVLFKFLRCIAEVFAEYHRFHLSATLILTYKVWCSNINIKSLYIYINLLNKNSTLQPTLKETTFPYILHPTNFKTSKMYLKLWHRTTE
jgi:hypothetical protein